MAQIQQNSAVASTDSTASSTDLAHCVVSSNDRDVGASGPNNTQPLFWASPAGNPPPTGVAQNSNAHMPHRSQYSSSSAFSADAAGSERAHSSSPEPVVFKNSHPYNDPSLQSFERLPQNPQQRNLHPGPTHRHTPFIHRKKTSEIPNIPKDITTNNSDNLNQPLENNNSVRHSWHPDSLLQRKRQPSDPSRIRINPQSQEIRLPSQSRNQNSRPSSTLSHPMAATAIPSKYTTSSEEWKERGAASIIKTETDENGKVSTRVIKKGVQDFEFGRTLGIGSYSTVVGATDKQSHRSYAIKILDKRHIIKEKKVKYVDIEKNTLNRLGDHPGIVRLYYTFQDESSLYFVLDYASNGELLSLIKRVGTLLSNYVLSNFSDGIFR